MFNKHKSLPVDGRDGLEEEALNVCRPPRSLVRQANVNQDESVGSIPTSGKGPIDKSWFTKLSDSTSPKDFKSKLSQRFAKLSSLGSTHSLSSMELDSNEQQAKPTMPLISITAEDAGQAHQVPSESQRRQEAYRNYYGRNRAGLSNKSGYRDDHNADEYDDDEDAFEDSPLPIPYSSSSMSRTAIIREESNGLNSFNSHLSSNRYEDFLDDRQGMNDGEQQFTKGEKLNRLSIDGSIISELRMDGKKSSSGKGGSIKKDKQRRSKSPTTSSSGVINKRGSRQSRRGFLGLASRLKLTKKHESIARLQLSILNSRFVSINTKSIDRDLQTFLPKERLTLKKFEERVKLMREYKVLANIEYRFASKYETYVCKHAQQETNQAKNNYKKCIPYDYNRVVLKTLPNVPDSDYVNASHVDSCLKPNAYIAAQGPNEFTIDDFWRMVWEQKTFVIVMLTKVFDFIRVMCNQYWPVEVNKPERYGNLEVTLLYEEPLADFVIRTIKLTKLRNSQLVAEAATAAATAAAAAAAKGTPLDGSSGGGVADTGTANGNELIDRVAIQTAVNETDDEVFNYSDDDDTSETDELDGFVQTIANTANQTTELNGSSANLAVRAPKFTSTKSMRRGRSDGRRNSHSGTADLSGGAKVPRHLRGTSPALSEGDYSARATSQPIGEPAGASAPAPAPPNEFLHPLFNATHIGASSNSLISEPNTPATPRTPSSAGLDRSSATRKAVKKKRRARVKNQRPKRTQFMVPSESQLREDDDENGEEENEGAEEGEGQRANNERIIYQFHYHSWASHTCPFISSLLHFRRRVRICMDEMSKSGKTGPTIVHCNDGCGRTGTYLCIDANLELAEEDNVLDVFNYTKKMRQSRKFLIENLEQYKFVYDTIEESLFCGKTWFPLSELHQRLKHKSQRNPVTKKNEYLREYEKMCRMTSKFSIGDCAGGHRVENREKNRDVSTVPPDNFRPYLTSFQTNDNTDYINAVFVDGYTRSKEYIVTEWPIHKTISDFWSLVYDHDCNSVILLANPGESSTYPSFLPSEKELRRQFGPAFSAEMVSYTHYQNIKSWIYTINKKDKALDQLLAGVKSEAKTTQVFQITCWPQGHRVPTSTNALVELMNMVERWRQRTTYGPVCVVSLNGKSRAGVYCAANVAIEQVVQHSEVDVFQAVKTVRRHRPQLIENMTEYKYCYDLILHYVLHYVNNQTATN